MKLQKETGSHGRWYGDACGTAFALELVGERWSLLIVRELMLGGRRFSDLRASLHGISAKVLTERLESLEQAGVLNRRKLPPPASAQIYELTEWGYLAEPAIQELGRWAARSPDHDPHLPLSPVGMMLSMRTMLVPSAMGDASGTIGIAVGADEFLADLQHGELPVRRGPVETGDTVFRMAAPTPMLRMIYGHEPLEDVEISSDLIVEGNRDLARFFVNMFALPAKLKHRA